MSPQLQVRTTIIIGIAILLAMLVDPMQVQAEERSLSLKECVDLALEHNLDLEVGQQEPLIAKYGLRGAQSAYEPTLNVDVGRRSNTSPGGIDSQTKALFTGTKTREDRYGAGLRGPLPIGSTYSIGVNRTRTDGTNSGGDFLNVDGFAGIEFRQPLLKNLWIDTTRLRIAIGKLNWKISESELRELLMRLVTNVELAYYDLVASRDRLTIIQQSYELAAQLVKTHQKQVEVGRMARLDEKQAQARVATSEASLFAARNAVTERENDLKLLITDDFATWADLTIVPATQLLQEQKERSRFASWNRALTNRPDVMQARLILSKAHVQLQFEKNQRFPSLDLTASYGYSGTGTNIRRQETPNYGFAIELSFPLGNGQARARQRVQQLRKRQALIAYKKLEQRVMADVVNALNAVDSSARRVTATGEARAFAEVALEAEQKKLANGKSTNFIVLQLQADLTQARLNETLAVVDYNRALSALAFSEASTLDGYSITLQTTLSHTP